MKHTIYIFALFTFFACNSGIDDSEIHYLSTQEDFDEIMDNHEGFIYRGDITIGPFIKNIQKLNSILEIQGSLKIRDSKLSEFTLDSLQKVQELNFISNTEMERINLPHFIETDSTIILSGNSNLASIQMPKLKYIRKGGFNCGANLALSQIKLNELESYNSFYVRGNPQFQELIVDEKIPEACTNVNLEFESIHQQSILFPDSHASCDFELHIADSENSYLNWMSRLEPNNILGRMSIYGEYTKDQFCFLYPKLLIMSKPANFVVYKELYKPKFNGIDIILECN